jgi:hydrogenase maturation protease
MKTILIGLGNPILGDDAVGWRVVQRIVQFFPVLPAGVDVDVACLGGLSLMERLEGYDRAVLVDAIHTGQVSPGYILHLSLDDLPSLYAGSAHDISLKGAIETGRTLGVKMPEDIQILAIEIDNQREFSGSLSPNIESGLEQAIEAVLQQLI